MLKNGNGWFLQSYELMPLLGFQPGSHLPSEGFEPRMINGVTFKCEPAKAPRYNGNGRRVKVSKHRLFYLCTCMKWIPTGRASQHLKGKVHR
jgi:hypothetical protein